MAMADLSAVGGGETDVSLIALTSHFAQVQFRLKQITSSPAEKREGLLRQLEEFAFKGCPVKLNYDSEDDGSVSESHDQLHQLLSNLQIQLSELTGTPPTSPASFDKQSIILDELNKKFDVQFEDIDSLSEQQVRDRVSEALHTSTQHKDTSVKQLICQVRSMEQHITQLQSELAMVTSSPSPLLDHHDNHESNVPLYDVQWGQDDNESLMSLHHASSEESLVGHTPIIRGRGRVTMTKEKGDKEMDSLRRILGLMQILTLWGCGGRIKLTSMLAKHSVNNNEYPSAVRSLELTVDRILVITTAVSQPDIDLDMNAQLESELFETVSMSLSDSLQALLEHGWVGQTTPTSCVPPLQLMGVAKLNRSSNDCIAWRTIMYYYYLKKGPKLCDKPDLKLSSSFSLPVDSNLKPKQSLLSCIYHTDKSFMNCRHYKTDVKFRSLVCQGFNLRHLHDWVRVLINNPSLVDELYLPSSFAVITKFRPVLQILERLTAAPRVAPVTLPSSYYHHVN